MKILITGALAESGLSVLREHDIAYEMLDSGKKMLKKSALIRALRKESYDGMICMLTDSIDAEVLDAAGSGMKIVANYAVGYNNIAVALAKEKNIIVTNTPGVLTDTVAEHTVGLIFAAAQRIAEADRFVRAKQFVGWKTGSAART